ncbi:ribonuclease D [Anaerotardibacter muris]|uniref:ribonuclease D n=1 Tax=Anaerotardibacter muris TaxID=2941505 RepID=UPI00203C4574|nr:ribonuclease D [Anaerotardibacter muris]
MIEPQLIESNVALATFAESCMNSPYMAIDTEFLREKTYYPKTCLIQIGIEGHIAIIDPLAVTNLDVLARPLTDPGIVKIFHACTQDMDIILRETGVLPAPVFDTQIAATLLGKNQQASYATLVSQYCGVELSKKDSFTDWSRRPLSPSQVQYASDDVLYLPEIHQKMVELLEEKNRLDWLTDAFEELSSPEKYVVDPYTRYKKLKRVNQLKPRQLSAAREFAAWRELKAQSRNIPRKWVVSDEQIVEACRREACTLDELFMVRGLRDSLKTSDAREVVECIKKGLDIPKDELPVLQGKARSEANVDAIVDVLSGMARKCAKENDIAPQTLASHAELTKLARGHYDDCELLKGWRRRLLGDELLDFLAGKLLLRIADGNLEIVSSQD